MNYIIFFRSVRKGGTCISKAGSWGYRAAEWNKLGY